MNVYIFRLDLILADLLALLGPVWLVVALVVLGYVAFGRLIRATVLTVCVLLCTQFWFPPILIFARSMRWSLVLILAVRGVLYFRSKPAPAGERRTGRTMAIALGVLSLASAAWSENPVYALQYGVSFCLGLVVAFGLLWRLGDEPSAMAGFARGALYLSLAVFGLGFAVAGVTYVLGEWQYFNAVSLDYVDGEFLRYKGLFYNPNAVGLLGTMMLPMLVAAPREALGRGAWLRVPTCLLALASIFLSGSRSAVIGAVLVLALLALYRFGAGAVVTFAVGAATLAILAVYSPVEDVDSSAVAHIARTKHLSTLSGRLELWQAGWDDAQGHLLMGQGWGHSRALGDVDTDNVLETGTLAHATNLHNAHLQLLLDVGFVGVAVFWAFCLCILQAGWWLLTAPKSHENAVGVVVFTSVLAMLADTWVHGSIWSMGSPTTLAFWSLCGLTLKQGERARRRAAEPWAGGAAFRNPAQVGAT